MGFVWGLCEAVTGVLMGQHESAIWDLAHYNCKQHLNNFYIVYLSRNLFTYESKFLER